MPPGDAGGAAELAAAHHLRLAGRWELALAAIASQATAPAAELRAEILVDRHLWRLDPPEEAEAAVAAVAERGSAATAALLRGQLLYWRLLFPPAPAPAPDDARRAEEALARAAEDPRLEGWATFWLGVLADNVLHSRAVAADRYARAAHLARARRDRLLDSYTSRHQGSHLLIEGDRAGGVELLRRSLHLRASLGAVPQVAAAQAALAQELPAGAERAILHETALATARELELTWLRSALEA